jgi:hypothetical protein
MDDLVERIDRQMCNRRSEDQCGCPLCVILAEAAAEIRSLRAQVEQAAEFICRKCGQRQDGPTDNEARF